MLTVPLKTNLPISCSRAQYVLKSVLADEGWFVLPYLDPCSTDLKNQKEMLSLLIIGHVRYV